MDTRSEQNQRTNQWLLENYDRMKLQENETREPIVKRGTMKCNTVIEQAQALYNCGRTHKEIAALLGMSISSAGRLIRMNKKDNGKRRH